MFFCRGKILCIVVFTVMLISLMNMACLYARAETEGTMNDPIVDSDLSVHQAIYENQPPGTPVSVQLDLELLDVLYWGFDGKVHKGQIVVHKDLVRDTGEIFSLMLKIRYPVYSVLPIAHPEIQKKAPYGLSPDTDNTSGYVFRKMVKGKKLSMHAVGRAIDLNPRQNPYIRGELQLPPRSSYDPDNPATLTPEHPVVKAFKAREWRWGGDWAQKGRPDYMHFEKP